MNRKDWMVNLQNAAVTVGRAYGNAEVTSILRKYGASSLKNLQPSYYPEAYFELEDRAKQAEEDADD